MKLIAYARIPIPLRTFFVAHGLRLRKGFYGALALARLWRALLPRLRKRLPVRSERHVVMLVVSNLRIDPRVERAAKTAAADGYKVTIISPDLGTPPIAEQPLAWGPGIHFKLLPMQSCSYVMEFPWLASESMYASSIEERPTLFHCHDLTTALIGLAASRKVEAYCLCDFHEWFSENVSWNSVQQSWVPHPQVKRQVLRWAERIALVNADRVITVCDSIAGELSKMVPLLKRRIDVVRNIPLLRSSKRTYPSLKKQLGLAPDSFLLLWQGGTGPTRLLEPIIEALKLMPRVTFVIRGPSLELFGEGYRALARQHGVSERLILLPPVPSADVVDAAHGADAGIWTLPNLGRNFYFALPNKIFEYLAAGLPVLAANFPEAQRLVEGNQVGLCFDPYDAGSIAKQVNRLVEEPRLAERFRKAIPAAMELLQADKEWDKLVKAYGELQNSCG